MVPLVIAEKCDKVAFKVPFWRHPLPFLHNWLADQLPPEAVISMYADDVSILAIARIPEEAQQLAQ